MFQLPRFSAAIEEWMAKNSVIPDGRKNESLAMLRRGMADLSVTRPQARCSWGIPVPEDELIQQPQVFYVWLDALANYLTGGLRA